MPPKAKYTREEISEAAFQMTRKMGIQSVTARELGRYMGTSSGPIFSYFTGMEDVKKTVKEKAKALYREYMVKCLEMSIPFQGAGMQHIRFAAEQPYLFDLLFMWKNDSRPSLSQLPDSLQMGDVYSIVRNSVMEYYGLNEKAASRMFLHLWIYGHGIACLCAEGMCSYTVEEIAGLFAEQCAGILKLFKEVPGMEECIFDPAKAFSSIPGVRKPDFTKKNPAEDKIERNERMMQHVRD